MTPNAATIREKRAREYSIAAVDRALDLLEALARIGPASLAELAQEARCTRTAGFRLLRTLQERGFAIQDQARGAWRLGARWSTFGQAAASQGALAAAAMPYLEKLGHAAGENACLRIRDGFESETVAVFQPSAALRRYAQTGQRRPLHAGGSRLLLAYAPESVQTQVLAQKLPRFTEATLTDPKSVAGDLPRIRGRGFLITSDEVVPGTVTVTVPVRDAAGGVIASLFITAPSLRMRLRRPKELLAMLQESADALSRSLGYRPSAPAREPTNRAASPTSVTRDRTCTTHTARSRKPRP